MTDVLGYVRVSTHEQAQSGLGLAAQRTAIEAACTARGWALTGVVVDEGASGSNLAREGLHEALRALSSGQVSCLVVAKLDRLSRSLMDFAALMERAREERWNLVALDLGIDLSTPSGALMANVMASFAEYERRLIGQRTADALAALRAQGRPISRPAVADVDGLAERIAGMRAGGMTYAAIAEHLNHSGVPTMRGAASWGVSAVRGAAGYQRPAPRRQTAELPTGRRRVRA